MYTAQPVVCPTLRIQSYAERAEYECLRLQAVANSDHRWLLPDQWRATQKLRNQMSVLLGRARPGTFDELRLRHAQELHVLAEKHLAQFARYFQNLDR